MAKPITYYCDALTAEQAQAIEALSKPQLMQFLADIGNYLYEDLEQEEFEQSSYSGSLRFPYLTAHDNIKLIRGLCDRIEEKLQEAKPNADEP